MIYAKNNIVSSKIKELFSFPVTVVYFLISTEEFVKIIFERSRLKSGKWIRNIVKEYGVV